MPVFDAVPSDTTAVTNDQWTLGAGASKTAACKTNDGGTSYIQEATLNQKQDFHMGWPDAVGLVNDLQVRGYFGAFGGANECFMAIRIGGSRTTYDCGSMTGGAYGLEASGNLARPGGGSWAAADFDATTVEWECELTVFAAGTARCTQAIARLDYETPAGVVPFFLSFLGAGLVYPFLTQFRAHLEAARALTGDSLGGPRWTLREDEVLTQWDLYKSRTFPRYVFLGV